MRSSLAIGEQIGVGAGGLMGAPKSVDPGDDLLEQVGADLELADAGFSFA
jgi:hypothetical protein